MALQQSERGLVAILDALGAANYSETEITRFLTFREVVLQLLNEQAEAILGEIKSERITTFTFNDTVLIVFRTNKLPTLKQIKAFCSLLRKFMIDSLAHRILFRGAVAIGSFYVNDDTNTVMGTAVTDAAAWYNRAEWIGINATPQASIIIQSLLEQDGTDLHHLIIDYPVPLTDKSSIKLKAINWPKGFYVSGVTPCHVGQNKRAKCLSLLGNHKVPLGTESKYFNSIAFFDHVASLLVKKKKR